MKNLIRFFALNGLTVLFLTSCVEQEIPTTELEFTEVSKSSLFPQVQNILQNKCLSCHTPSASAGHINLSYTSEADFISNGYVSVGSPQNSSLLYRIKGAGLKPDLETMPIGGKKLTELEIDLINEWIVSLKQTKAEQQKFDLTLETSLSHSELAEEAKEIQIIAKLNKKPDYALQIPLQFGGDARFNSDYEMSPIISFNKGQTQTSLIIKILDDELKENDETIIISNVELVNDLFYIPKKDLLSLTVSINDQASDEGNDNGDGGSNGGGGSTPPVELTGAQLYSQNCMNCHGNIDSTNKRNRSVDQIKQAIGQISKMSYLSYLTDLELTNIAQALKDTATAEDKYKCDDQNTIPASDARYLTRQEYKNVIKDIFGNSALAQIDTEINSIPVVQGHSTFESFQATFGKMTARNFIKAGKKVSDYMASNLVSSHSCLSSLSDSQISNVTNSCVNSFIDDWGFKILRRPLGQTEKTDLLTFTKQTPELKTVDAIKNLLYVLLQHPDFIFRIEDQGNIANNIANLTQYEIASRLSFSIWSSVPDEQLYNAAKSGNLATKQQIMSQATRMLQSPKGQNKVTEFFKQWLEINPSVPDTYTQHFLSNSSLGSQQMVNFYPDAITELDNFTRYIVYTKNGSYKDLLTSSWANLNNSSFLKNVYSSSSGGVQQLNSQRRSGILTRAAMHITGTNWKAPMALGASLRRNVLCEELPPPPDDAVAEFSVDDPTANGSLQSTRHRLELATEEPACIGCHSTINGLAFAFENYDSIGRYTTTESLYDGMAQHVGQIQVNAETKPLIDPTSSLEVKNAVELSSALANNTKAKLCFVKKYTDYSYGRNTDQSFNCSISNSYEKMTESGSILEMMLSLYSQDYFIKKRFNN